MGKISDYTRVLAAKLADVFVCDQTDNGTTETKSATVEQIGTAIGTLQNFADLDTSNKNLVSAINEIASYTPVYGNTASGAIATFDTSLALPLQDCTIEINAVQESGTPTPSSPKLISGFTGANIQRCNNAFASLWDIDSSFKGSVVWNQLIYGLPTLSKEGVTTSYSDGVFTITNDSRSTNYSSGSTRNRITYTVVKTNHKYILLATSSKNITGVGVRFNTSGGVETQTFFPFNTVLSATDNGYYVLRINYTYDFETVHPIGDVTTFKANIIDLTEMFGSTIADYIYNLEQATTGAGVAFFKSLYPDDYYAYDSGTSELVGDTIVNVSWQDEAGTVYGGSLDVTSGVLMVTYGSIADIGQLTWESVGNYKRALISDAKAGLIGIKSDKYTCLATREQLTTNDQLAPYNASSKHLTCLDTPTSGFLIYQLETPVTYQLTPTQISAIVGTNNVFTDTNGDTSVVYACSLKDYIDNQ